MQVSPSPSLCHWCPGGVTHPLSPRCSQLPLSVSFVAPLPTRRVQHALCIHAVVFPLGEAVNDLLFQQQSLKQNGGAARGQMRSPPGRACYLSSSQAVCYANKPHALFSQPPADFATHFVSEESALSRHQCSKEPGDVCS